MYKVELKEGHAISMHTLKGGRTIQGLVIAEDEEIAWRSKIIFSDNPRRDAGVRLQAHNMAKRFEVHYQSTGERWEHVIKARKEAEARTKRIDYLVYQIGKLQAELADLEKSHEQAQA